ncbi:hypothetical protein [Romboutsia sp.]|uniref:hypothetical protein n=1 Tax=Romboutsia sp. TaxID=1965302 RepID=UPI002C51F386|nr:hypothetical protein [Romboutsia sp.]HSQ90194.1 hypothetical protein [Romboutsia sp.]
MAMYYNYEHRQIKEGDTVIIGNNVETSWKIDDLIVGGKRKKHVGKMYTVKSKRYLQNGAIRIELNEVYGIVWSPKMLTKTDREVNEI